MVDNLVKILNEHKLFNQQTDSHYLFSKYASEDWNSLPEYGFKIHISATTSNFESILKKFFKYYSRNQHLLFKIIANTDKLSKQNVGFFGLSQVGKFITIYPHSEDEFQVLLNELELIYKLDRSIRIPSDKRFLNSEVVYYRYGEFKFHSSHNDKRLNNGLVYDKYTFSKYHLLPKRYVVLDIIQKSGNNGIYRILDTKSKKIKILKESVPFGAISKNNVDSVNRKINEFFILKSIEENFVPKVFDIFWIEDSLCIVTDYVSGIKLGKVTISDIDVESRVSIFVNLVEQILIIHQNYNVIINDISMNNVIVDSENNVKIVDFEMSKSPLSIYTAERVGTAGFYDRHYPYVDYSQDIFSLGKILFYLFMPETYTKEILKETNHDIKNFMEKSVFEKILMKTNNHEYLKTIDFYTELKEIFGERNFKSYKLKL